MDHRLGSVVINISISHNHLALAIWCTVFFKSRINILKKGSNFGVIYQYTYLLLLYADDVMILMINV